MNLFITWNPNIVAIDLGFFAIRWYSLCWCIGLMSVYLLMHRLYRQQKIAEEKFEPMFIYCFLGILIGARLGHCLFYEPEVWLSSWQRVLEIFIPIQIEPGGGWHFTGYAGLASHGGTLGLMIALWLYYRKTKMNLWHVLDDIAIATGITACFIRLGNLMNSEIIGKPTDVPWAFIFEQVDMQPRHPGQLYEAVAYLLLFFLMLTIYRRDKRLTSKRVDKLTSKRVDKLTSKQVDKLTSKRVDKLTSKQVDKQDETNNSSTRQLVNSSTKLRVGTGFYFGLCLTYIFTFRFFIEYTKEIQVAKEAAFALNIGQQLSIPFIILGVACMIRGVKKLRS